MKPRIRNAATCPITGLNFSNDNPRTFEKVKAKRDYRRKTYQPKKVKNETI